MNIHLVSDTSSRYKTTHGHAIHVDCYIVKAFPALNELACRLGSPGTQMFNFQILKGSLGFSL